MLSHGSGKGYHLFGLGDHVGTGLGEAVADGCSFTGGDLVGGVNGDNGGDHPNKM